MLRRVLVLAVVAAAAMSVVTAGEAGTAVVTSRGHPIEIAVVLDKSDGAAVFEPGIRDAIQMAVDAHPTIKGFPIQLNDGFDAPCGESADAIAANAAVAAAVVANPQNVAVIGHMCSVAFGASVPLAGGGCSTPPATALGTYENADVVAVDGSTTDPCLGTVGPSVFDSTAVGDPSFGPWYAQVKTLPDDLLWQVAYTTEFGTPPTDFADLYYDATNLLLRRLDDVSQLVDGRLAVDRASLALAVRDTTRFQGVTCTVSFDSSTGLRVDDLKALARCTG
jgi:hypothetical protein